MTQPGPFQLTRALRQVHRELRRLDDETYDELAMEVETLQRAIVMLCARIGEVVGAPAEEVQAMWRAASDDGGDDQCTDSTR